MTRSNEPIPLYDLANYRYQRTQITTNTGEIIEGQFVRYYVLEGTAQRFYSLDHYCFCPAGHVKEFFDLCNKTKSILPENPKYIRQFKMGDIVKIIILPLA